MARFLAVLLLAPCLAVLAFLYWLYVRKSHTAPARTRRDAIIVVLAFIAAVAGAVIAWQAALGHGGPIWKFMAGPVGAYAGFNLILAAGLWWHWRERHRAGRALRDHAP